MSVSTTLALVLALFSFSAQPGDGHEHPPKPPPAAIEACDGLNSGDSCEFSGREGEAIDGSCWSPQADKPLACRPSSPPPSPPR